jgi:lipopolysaccharide export system protein LptA
MEYDLKHKILAIHGKVWSTLSAKEGKGAFMGSSAASSPAVVAADEMQYWTESGQARYKGNVRLLSEDQQLQTQFLDIFGGGERIEAQGGVRHLISRKDVAEASLPSNKPKGTGNSQSAPILVKSSRLNYSKGSGALAYSGNVTVRSGNLSLSSGTLDAFLDKEKRFEHATARGEVQIRQGDRECMGEVADWFVDTGKLVVSGNPAEVYDPGRGRSFARRLTSFSADDRILLESR